MHDTGFRIRPDMRARLATVYAPAAGVRGPRARRAVTKHAMKHVVLAVCLCGSSVAARAQQTDTTITVMEGTSMALAVSPDGARLVIDLQGTLWVLPSGGGAATAITDPLH